MLKSVKITVAFALLSISTSALASDKFGIGREALPEEIAAWDIDVRPDGAGLPQGKGKVSDGEKIFAEQCASCHGDFGEGKDRWPELAGGADTLKSDDPVKTIGSFWPYTSTVFDYVHRAMPFGNAQSLSADDTYALTAYLLYLNDVVTDTEFELSKENFNTIKLPNEGGFIDDSRPDTPTLAAGEPCMKDCKPEVKITARARILDVTPENGGDDKEGGSLD
jgi:S-disulfanyl-L-cysteine oxidoreductase SoxD